MAGFNVQFVDFAPSQIAQHGSQIDFVSGAGHVDHRHAHGLQCRPFFGFGVGRGVNPDLARLLAFTQGIEQAGVEGHVQPAVHHHQMRLTWHIEAPHIELRVVFQHGADAGQDGAGPGTPNMAIGSRLRRRDPLALAIFKGALPV